MAEHWSLVAAYVAPFISGAFGVGVAWQSLKSQLKVTQEKTRDLIYRIEKMEMKLETRGVSRKELDLRCRDCHTEFSNNVKNLCDTLRIDRQEFNSRLDRFTNALISSKHGSRNDTKHD